MGVHRTWGEPNEIKTITFHALLIQLPLFRCLGGCAVNIVISVPTQTALPQLPVDLAMSSMFDPTLPQRITSSHTLAVVGASSEITVDVKVDAAVAKPGQKAGFTVALKDAAGNPVAGEVAVFVVDKAFLDVKPHPPQDVGAKLKVDLSAPYRSMVSNTDAMIGGAAYEAASVALHRPHRPHRPPYHPHRPHRRCRVF